MTSKADPISQLYGARLRSVREERNLRQADVARRLDMSAGGYSSVERGMARMFVSDLSRYADALGVDAGYLGRRLGLCGDMIPHQIYIGEGADLLQALADEPAEIQPLIIQGIRQVMEIARSARLARSN